jgi:hypothetical protein
MKEQYEMKDASLQAMSFKSKHQDRPDEIGDQL